MLKPLLELVQDDRENDHQAGDDLFPEFLDAEQYEAICEDSNNQRSDDCSPYSAASARQGSATQHDGRDGIEFVAFTYSGVSCDEL